MSTGRIVMGTWTTKIGVKDGQVVASKILQGTSIDTKNSVYL